MFDTFKVRILGSGAGGGLPQWNCNCKNCNNCRNMKIPERSQSSIAVTIDDKNWILINSSPDFRYQYNELFKKYFNNKNDNIRNNSINNIILLDSQIDHVTGLLSMRESKELNIYSTTNIYHELTNDFNLLTILKYYCKINFTKIDNTDFFNINSIPNLEFKFIFLQGKPPPYSKNRKKQLAGDNLGIIIKHKNSSKYIFYAPGIEIIDDDIINIIKDSEYTFIDGTVWTSNELIDLNISNKTSYEMGHIPVSELISILEPYDILRKIYLIHINNTNPILDSNSNEYKILMNTGIHITNDNMELII